MCFCSSILQHYDVIGHARKYDFAVVTATADLLGFIPSPSFRDTDAQAPVIHVYDESGVGS